MSQHRNTWIAMALGMSAVAASAQDAPAQDLPPLAPAISAARMTLAQAAAHAAPPQAAALVARMAPVPAPVPVQTPAAPPAPAPDLVELLGRPDHPRARIAIGGEVYSVSAARPTLGASPWTLVKIDVESRSVVLRRGSGRHARTVRLDLGQRQGRRPGPDRR